jgi:hypothetical protein
VVFYHVIHIKQPFYALIFIYILLRLDIGFNLKALESRHSHCCKEEQIDLVVTISSLVEVVGRQIIATEVDNWTSKQLKLLLFFEVIFFSKKWG